MSTYSTIVTIYCYKNNKDIIKVSTPFWNNLNNIL